MDERRARVLVQLLEVDHQFRWVVLGVRKNLRTEECNNVIRDHVDGLGLEIRVVDPEVRIEPVNLVCD